MKASDTDQFRHLAAGAAALDVRDVLDRIANFTLNRSEGQAGVGLERQPCQTIECVCGGTRV
jgi:hypothetical protein